MRRYNQSRRAFIEADLSPGVELGTATKKIYALPTLQHLPLGVHLVKRGDTEYFQEMMQNFALAMGAGVLMVFAVLVLLFARVFQPITILSALPLSLGGAALALLITDRPFSLAVVIGFLMLMGIVAKNSILLVDFAIEEMRAGKSRLEAHSRGGTQARAAHRHDHGGDGGGDASRRHGLGRRQRFSFADGDRGDRRTATSTLLTLVIVPAVFTLFDDIERWMAPKAREAPRGTGRQRGWPSSVEGATPGHAAAGRADPLA